MSEFNRDKLADCLFEVAQRYFTGEGHVCTRCGICAAVDDFYGPNNSAYTAMSKLMKEIGEPAGAFYGDYVDTDAEWEPRAWMCLFLYEYLVQGG